MKKVLIAVMGILALSAGVLFAAGTGRPSAQLPAAAAGPGPERIWNTFLGGTARDWAFAIAADEDGNTYITGLSASTWGSPLVPYVGGYDVFLAKLDPYGSLVWNTFLGGSGDDIAYGIALDTSGNIYLNGLSRATWGSPVRPFTALEDGFVAKVAANGTRLWNTFLGGAGLDGGIAKIAVDAAGNAYVTGQSNAIWGSPVTAYASGWDGYAAKLDTNGVLQWSTFVGGPSNEYGYGIALDTDGNCYIAGDNYEPGGVQDAFVAKLDASGTLQWKTAFGGSGTDYGSDLVVDDSGNAYVAGSSYGTWGSPISPYVGGDEGYVAKFSTNGALLWNTFLGGSGDDGCSALVRDAAGNIYIIGISTATWRWPASPLAGSQDVFAAWLDTNGLLRFNTFLGGAGAEMGRDIALDANGDCIVLGDGNATWGSPILPYVGDWDIFVAKIRPANVAAPVLSSIEPVSASAGDAGLSLSVAGTGFIDGCVVTWDGSDRPTTFIGATEVEASIDASDLAAGKTVQVTVRNPGGGVSNSLAFAISNPVPILSSLSTTHVTGGGTAFTLTVLGSQFVPGSVVRWNGSDRATTFVGSTELRADIAAADIASGGDAQVTVFNPSPAGGVTGALAVQVSSFTAGATPSSTTVSAGRSATYTIQVTPQNGSFDGAVVLGCTGLPAKCTATFSPAGVTPGAGTATATLTLMTRAGAAAASISGMRGFGPLAPGVLALVLGLILAWTAQRRGPGRAGRRAFAACALIGLLILVGSCSSGSGDNNDPYSGTPKGTHQISVQAVSGTMTVSTTVTLVVN
jgi:hypothetical protein